jgi:urate oxidase
MRIHYGKDAISVYRSDGTGSLWGAEVRLDVFGRNFEPAYTEGDNSMVIATDSMKNFVHAAAADLEGDSLEGFAELIGRRFLATYGHVERVGVRARERPFARLSPILFQWLDGDYDVVELAVDRDGVAEHRCGREALKLVKITGSSFAGFARDEFTTLPERGDRPLFVHLDVHWRYENWERRVGAEQVRTCVMETFDEFVSSSIQHLIHEMGTRALARFPELAELSFRAENRLWDSAEVAPDGERPAVYTDPRPPFGVITLTLDR